MHQITSGATHKVEVHDKKSISDFLEASEDTIRNLIDNQGCLYQNKKLIKDNALNYLNLIDGNDINNQLKHLIRKEYDTCEKLYPYLGDLFILSFFNQVSLETNSLKVFKFNKIHESDFLTSLNDDHVKLIAEWFFKNCSMENEIVIESYQGNEIVIEKNLDLNIKFDFDTDFMGSSNSYTTSNYRFIIIDGFIESVGEIHHLLHFACKTKEPYVIFCFGMSDDVKHTILKNNAAGKTEIFPVSIKFDENSINILNDIAVIHDEDVVSSLKGQTISQELRKNLPLGKNISFYRNGTVTISPIADIEKISIHKDYLRKRVDEASRDINTDVLIKRIKNLSIKGLRIYVPDQKLLDVKFTRNLDYFLRYLSSISLRTCKITGVMPKEYYVPISYIKHLIKKIDSCKNMYDRIDKVVMLKEKNSHVRN